MAFQRTAKQLLAWNYLTDKNTKFIGYGGAAGGGKSYIGCDWLQTMCTILPNSKWFIGRDSLKDTRESVVFTWGKLARDKDLLGWQYKDNHIVFDNGSEIEFLDLSFYPQKDPLYERFGSKEYTGGWIEEAGNVHPQALEILKTRIGRWYNGEYGLISKILITFNPKKNWLYTTFYRPYKNGIEAVDTKFIPALCSDNPFLEADYIQNLRNLKDGSSEKERLLYGNFDYDDDPTCLLDYKDIEAIWTNDHVEPIPIDGYKVITADIARYGSDKAIIMVWYCWVVVEYIVLEKCSMTELQRVINALRKKHRIGARFCIADEDGVGGGVVDNCRILGFHNGGKPKDPQYLNLHTECGYLLADNIQNIYFKADISDTDKQTIESELGQLKTYDSDKDGKLKILPKEKIKENIGHSPDWLDNFKMRMYFELYDAASSDAIRSKISKLLL